MKRLLLAGVLSLIGAAPSFAQVTSINAVGYMNVTVPPGFSMIANQLGTANNTIQTLIPNPVPGMKIFKWNGSNFAVYEFIGLGLNVWSPDGNATLSPGEGAFIQNPTGTNIVITFVGEVQTGNLVNPLPAGFSIRSSMVPQSGSLTTQLNFPTEATDKVFRYNNAGNNYSVFEFVGFGLNVWSPQEPTADVGESFFVFKANTSNWTRSFSIN